MALDIVARAEPPIGWEELSRGCRRALGRDATWRDLDGGAVVEVGPADPLVLEHREGALLAHARTSPWGPGYHQRIVDVLDRLATALPGGWSDVQDATGHYHTRRRSDLCRRFLEWAHALWSDEARLGAGGLGVGLSEAPLEVPEGLVATPTGFKGMRWVRTTRAALARARRAARPDRPGRAAREAFLWWCATPDAFDLVQLGRSLCATEVIWRPVSGQDDPEQESARRRALDCFERALARDSRAPVPTAELQRLYELTGRRRGAAPLARAGAGRPFWGGYREGWIRLPIGRWTIAVPGWLRGAVSSDGHDVFWDDEMTVHITVRQGARREFSARAEAARHVDRLAPAERARARVEVLEAHDVRGFAVVVPTPGVATRDALIQGLVAHGGDRVGFTVVARSRAARDLGLRVGRFLRPA